jgi:hypothetical protein
MSELKKLLQALLQKGGGVGAAAIIIGLLLNFTLDMWREKRIDSQDVIAEYRIELTRLREMQERCIAIELKYAHLQTRFQLLESATNNLPFPMWTKSAGTAESPGVMLTMNKAYADFFLKPVGKTINDYRGKTDAEMWGTEIGSRYWQGDLEVMNTGAQVKLVVASHILDSEGKPVKITVYKYPRKINGVIVGIGGIAIPRDF